jgi:hypothetical protein
MAENMKHKHPKKHAPHAAPAKPVAPEPVAPAPKVEPALPMHKPPEKTFLQRMFG